MNKKFYATTFRRMLIIIFLLVLTLSACGGKPVEIAPAEPAQPGAGELEITNVPTSTTWPILRTTMGDFAVVSTRLVDQAQGMIAPPGQRFLLVGLAGPDGEKLVFGEFPLEAFQKMVLDRQDETYVLGNDGAQTFATAMGGWIADDFVMGFTVPIADTYTLYWPENSPILLNIEATADPSLTQTAALDPSVDGPWYSAVDPALVTKPDVPAQTINDVTAAIDWAYADESRVTVVYTISGLDWPDDVQLDPAISATLSSQAISSITSQKVVGIIGYVKDGRMSGYIDQMLTMDAVDAVRTPVVDLQVDIPVDGTGAVLSPFAAELPVPIDLPNVGTFHFAFDMPIYKAIRLMDIDQTVETNGIAMTIKSLILNRSHVDALLCFQMPSAQDWGAEARFSLASQPDTYYQGSSVSDLFRGAGNQFSLTDSEHCISVGGNVHYDSVPTTVTISIQTLKTWLPESIPNETIQQANARMANQGIVIEGSDVNSFNILKQPDWMTDDEVYSSIYDALKYWYEGPWEFTVEVKP